MTMNAPHPASPELAIRRLLDIMARLRDPVSGCPWDIEQDFASIAPYTIEEAYEVADAIERQAWGELEGELGDLLLQVVYHAQMGAEAGHFDFNSVAETVSEKMVARHPHVFGAQGRVHADRYRQRQWLELRSCQRRPLHEGRVG
jgi:ATP diphosphatase